MHEAIYVPIVRAVSWHGHETEARGMPSNMMWRVYVTERGPETNEYVCVPVAQSCRKPKERKHGTSLDRMCRTQ